MPLRKKLNENGVLKYGVHDTTLAELKSVFCFNLQRRMFWHRFETFIETCLRPRCVGDGYLILGGSFVSLDDNPNDIDANLIVPLHMVDEAASSGLFDLGTPTANLLTKHGFGIDFYVSIDGVGNDFSAFFSYNKTPERRKKQRRGVARLSCEKERRCSQSWCAPIQSERLHA